MTVDDLLRSYAPRPIPGCPGRWVLPASTRDKKPEELAGGPVRARTFRTARAADEVHVVELEDGALLSYAKEGGAFVHTLCTREGLARKLADLGAPTLDDAPEKT